MQWSLEWFNRTSPARRKGDQTGQNKGDNPRDPRSPACRGALGSRMPNKRVVISLPSDFDSLRGWIWPLQHELHWLFIRLNIHRTNSDGASVSFSKRSNNTPWFFWTVSRDFDILYLYLIVKTVRSLSDSHSDPLFEGGKLDLCDAPSPLTNIWGFSFECYYPIFIANLSNNLF